MNRLASIVCALLAITLGAAAEPTMPMGFVPATSNATGRAWRETGTLPQPLAMARVTVRASMTAQGYSLVHDIAESENASRRIQLWRRRDEDVILMLWQETLYDTGLAWGLSNRNEDTPDGTR